MVISQISKLTLTCSRLSRNELYSYGFKEGQRWAEDRQALESAFRALESEIWQPPSYGWPPSPPAAHAWYHPPFSRGGSFPQYPPHIPVNRSNDSEPYSFSKSSSRRPWAGHANGYPSRGRASHHGRPEDIPSAFFRPPFMPDSRTEGVPDRFFSPPQSSSSTSYRSCRSIEDSPEFPESEYHHGSPDAAGEPAEFSGHMELVRYNHGAEGEELTYSHSRDEPQAPPIPLSTRWSVTPTRGTSDSARSASSGYVESYDVSSYDNHYPRESDDGYEYGSDDEGIYSSSEDDGFGYDNFSDEGYYSEDAGGSYDRDDYYD